MGRIRDKILSKINKKDAEQQFYFIHHILMREYGWIPLEEFKKLPMQTVNNLFKEIMEEKKHMPKFKTPKNR